VGGGGELVPASSRAGASEVKAGELRVVEDKLTMGFFEAEGGRNRGLHGELCPTAPMASRGNGGGVPRRGANSGWLWGRREWRGEGRGAFAEKEKNEREESWAREGRG